MPTPSPGSTALPSDPTLRRLGWDTHWSACLAGVLDTSPAQDPPTLRRSVGRVSRADRGACDLLVAGPDGPTTVTATWSPALERAVAGDPTAVPAAGDWAVLTTRSDGGDAGHTLHTLLPRRSAVVRAQVGGTSHAQVLAANADIAAVVEGMVPDLDPARLERLLALAWSSGARPVVILTKSDLAADPAGSTDEVTRLAPGVEVLSTAAPTGAGLAPLHRWLADGATIALLGASGVGKSTLLNALVAGPGLGGPMATRTLGAENKGRHTTVTRELHLGPDGGAVLDTPGLRTIGLAAQTALDDVFPEVEELAARCRFTDCEHRSEPGCAVLAAVEEGTLPERRLLSYRKLMREAEYQAARTDARLRAQIAGRAKALARAQRSHPTRR